MPQPSALPVRPMRVARSVASLALATGMLCMAGTAGAQQRYDVGMRDGLVTIRANGAPADELALALKDATGVSFVITGEGATPLSAEIVDEPLHKAIALLAPNHLLVRESAATDAPIVEAILMMPDVDDGTNDSTEFLPSGAPADEVMPDEGLMEVDENGNPVDPATLRDPNRSADLQAISPDPSSTGIDNNAVNDGTSGADLPAEDPLVDPATGEPIAPNQ